MIELSITVDKQVESEFLRAMDTAYVFTKRTAAQFVNTAFYFIIRGAMADTPKADRGKIRSSLLVASKTNPKAPLVAIIINARRGVGNGLYGARMKLEQEKVIRSRQSHTKYIASRWIPALKDIGPATVYKTGAPKAPSMKLTKPATGGGLPAKEGENPKGYIFATIEKVCGAQGAYKILNDNLNRAIKEETASKLQYVLDKQIEEGIMAAFRS